MQENLIKNYVELESPLTEEYTSVNIILEIQMGEDKTVLESIKMNFNKNIIINDMLKEIIPNFNDSLENHKKKIYLNPNSNEYQLCECFETIEGGMRAFTNGNILEKRTKLLNASSKNLKLLYSPKDILLNFQKKKRICEGCLII